ncbi:MAG: hypothetical protein ACI90A_001785, partial [Shewanella sp.]
DNISLVNECLRRREVTIKGAPILVLLVGNGIFFQKLIH